MAIDPKKAAKDGRNPAGARCALVASWLASELSIPGFGKMEALGDLNEALGTHYSISRLGEFANGRRPLPPAVRQYMLRGAIQHVLLANGIATMMILDARLDAIADALS